jgi:hypothetical protein
MSAAQRAARIARKLRKNGRSMTLRRRVGVSTSFNDVVVYGEDRGYSPDQLLGGIIQGDRKVTISNTEIAAASWPGPPKKGDFLTVDGVQTALQGAVTEYEGSTILAHILWIRG